MSTLILRTATRMLTALLLLVSVYLLWRGHNEPGGGFVGGLTAAAAFILVAISDGWRAARRSLGVDPRLIALAGLGLAAGAGLIAGLHGLPFLTGLWWKQAGLPLGTPLLFDIGVYLAVMGSVLTVAFAIEREV
ncbi:MnhB domain-containing protein [Thalassobaculum sp.]|jgi:multisubunit Na+/H+ antiporter MnhB subunit|uniref:MnhB domain-containing protein n=1 Tax=Thalassobaculum sp. TaxID=2022740 RepID=UPI003B5A0473